MHKRVLQFYQNVNQPPEASEALQPFMLSYKASAMALVAGETFKLSLIGKSFQLFETAIQKYGAIHYLPEFMRGECSWKSTLVLLPKACFSQNRLWEHHSQTSSTPRVCLLENNEFCVLGLGKTAPSAQIPLASPCVFAKSYRTWSSLFGRAQSARKS